MKTYRLLPDAPDSWARYGDFEARVAGFAEKYLKSTPVRNVLNFLRERWVQGGGMSTGYWIGYDDDGTPCAHLCSWVGEQWGQPMIVFYQIEADPRPNVSLLQVMRQVGSEIKQWIEILNKMYESANSPLRICYGESMTWLEPALYKRLFRSAGFELEAERTVVRWTLHSTADRAGD